LQAENIPVLWRPDSKDLLAYLNCETAASLAPLESPTQVKRTADDTLDQLPRSLALKKTFLLYSYQTGKICCPT
jgi:hypothetical protein